MIRLSWGFVVFIIASIVRPLPVSAEQPKDIRAE